MKVTVLVRLKREVLDPQGDAVGRALGALGLSGVRGVRVGKLIEVELDEVALAGRTPADAIGAMADELLANPVTEDYEVVLGPVGVAAAGGAPAPRG